MGAPQRVRAGGPHPGAHGAGRRLATPAHDYQKYGGSLWQIHFLGELHANGDDERVQTAVAYAFSRQLAAGAWSCTNTGPTGSIPCLTSNVRRKGEPSRWLTWRALAVLEHFGDA